MIDAKKNGHSMIHRKLGLKIIWYDTGVTFREPTMGIGVNASREEVYVAVRLLGEAIGEAKKEPLTENGRKLQGQSMIGSARLTKNQWDFVLSILQMYYEHSGLTADGAVSEEAGGLPVC